VKKISKLNFESENLIVDWIGFNIAGLRDPEGIAVYLSEKFGFNSVVKRVKKGKSESLISKIENQFQVSFIKCTYNPESNSFWTATIVNFSGINATYFYNVVKTKMVNWSIFDLRYTNLGRFDLYYFRKAKSTDQNNPVELFLNNCRSKTLAKSKKTVVEIRKV